MLRHSWPALQRDADHHPRTVAGLAFKRQLSAQRFHTLAHARQPKRFPRRIWHRLRVEPFAVITDDQLEPISVWFAEGDPGVVGTGVFTDVRQRLLNNAQKLEG